MSGTRHHYIPQFLQAGFASKSKQVWVYTKDKEPYPTNTKNAAVEHYFYEKDSDPSLDNEITAQENEFAPLVKSLRDDSDVVIDPHHISRLISHFQIRTRHIRLTFINETNLIISIFINFIKDAEKFTKFISKKLNISQEIAKLVYQDNYFKIIDILNKQKGDLVQSTTKNAHINALQTSIKTYPLAKNYSSFRYHIYKTDNLILGDSVVLFETNTTSRKFCAFPDKNTKVLRVYLPLSPSKILVGCSDKSHPPEDFSNLNDYISKCSSEFFISNTNSTQNKNLVTNIGVDAMPLTDEEIEELLSSLLN